MTCGQMNISNLLSVVDYCFGVTKGCNDHRRWSYTFFNCNAILPLWLPTALMQFFAIVCHCLPILCHENQALEVTFCHLLNNGAGKKRRKATNNRFFVKVGLLQVNRMTKDAVTNQRQTPYFISKIVKNKVSSRPDH